MPEPRLTRRAKRDLSALPQPIRGAVFETLVAIGIAPTEAGKQLVGRLRGLWAARVGRYRVLYTIEEGQVIVRAIRHRAIAYSRPRPHPPE